MIVIESVEITPNPVVTNGTITISVECHEEYADVKKYKNKYPYRYGNLEK